MRRGRPLCLAVHALTVEFSHLQLLLPSLAPLHLLENGLPVGPEKIVCPLIKGSSHPRKAFPTQLKVLKRRTPFQISSRRL